MSHVRDGIADLHDLSRTGISSRRAARVARAVLSEVRTRVRNAIMTPAKLPPDAHASPGPAGTAACAADPAADPAYSLREAERTHIRRVLELFDWNKQHAARALRISRDTLYRKIAGYGLRPERRPRRAGPAGGRE